MRPSIQFGPEDHIPKVDDSSGQLKYIRIEFGGYPIKPNNEINGLARLPLTLSGRIGQWKNDSHNK